MTLTVDLDAARRYVAAFCGEGPACVQVFDDSDAKAQGAAHRSGPWVTLEGWATERNRAGCGVFLNIQETDGRGRTREHQVAARALFVESDGHRPLPTVWPLAPSVVVQRNADHWHAFWLLVPGEDLARVVPALTQLAGHWQGDHKVATLERVMRIPGFLHQKREPCAVALVECEPSRRFTIAEVLAAHPVEWDAAPEAYQRQARRDGLWAPVAPTVPLPQPAISGDAAVRAFRAWCAKVDTAEGKANHWGGRDPAAFQMACRGLGRGLPRAVVEEEVLAYLVRARFDDPESATRRIVASAASKPRRDDQPLRVAPTRPTERTGLRPSFFDDDDQAPPEPPAAQPVEPAPEPDQPWDGLDLERLRNRWSIGTAGVAPIEWNAREGEHQVKHNKRVGNLPIWPAQLGRDVATGRTYLRLGWVAPTGETRYGWLPEDDVKDGKPLLHLPEGPVAGTRWGLAAIWLTEARPAITQPAAQVTSALGWCGINGSRRWVWPGVGEAARAAFIGDPLPGHGKLADWTVGLRHVLGLGRRGYTALVCAAFSAAAPWARLLNGSRNPVIGLLARSSSGKGSVMAWALALWAEAQALTLPAGSTGKGLQDRAIELADLPLFVDELQQLVEQHPGLAGEVVYFLANGQRRVTSSKAQTAVGGERRHGVGFYAAEAPILPGQNEGVHKRVVELHGDPCPDLATSRVLRQAGQACGVASEAISKAVQARSVIAWIDTMGEIAAACEREHSGLQAGDGETLALLARGCDLLGEITGEEVPAEDCVAWLAEQIAAQRGATVDRETACLQGVLDWLCNLDWTREERDSVTGSPSIAYREEIAMQQHLVAWTRWGNGPSGKARLGLECDPTQRDLAQIFEKYGGERRVLPGWAARGWIERQGKDLKIRRWGAGRVVRFTRAALILHLGADALAPEPEAVS